MPGPPPKPAHLRQRRNKTPGEAQLPTEQSSLENTVPELPVRTDRVWHPKVLEWWTSVWRSPMASEWLDADMRGGLYLLADLHQARWEADDPGTLVKVSAEIRLQEVRFGLSPIDRSRLRWTIAHSDEAVEKLEARKEGKAPKSGKKDPRSVLKMVG